MAIGRTFKESLQKALRALEVGHSGFERPAVPDGDEDLESLWAQIDTPRPGRLWAIAEVLRRGASLREVSARSKIDPWFLGNVQEIVAMEEDLAAAASEERTAWLLPAKQAGFSDRRLAALWECSEDEVRGLRRREGVLPVYKRVDTCAAEFEAHTPYLYSTYEQECEARPSDRRKIVILGGGPNRIGQGIEFDYCCVHAAFALREAGFEAIMINCNPETVSTDYDTSDRLYFEPLTLEDVLAIVDREQPEGLIVQYGGQTPLRLAVPLERAGAPILGTSPDAIDRAEDRERFDDLLESLSLRRPPGGVARSTAEGEVVAARIGYPVLVRPSYVLGGRAMEIVHDAGSLQNYMRYAVKASREHPVLIDRFLADAIEVDVDAISDGQRVVVGGIMEHIEEAGVHSGDSACAMPPYSLGQPVIDEILDSTRRLALELGVCGLMNVQYAVKNGELFVIEVNPRASRTIPFVSKAIGRPLAKLGALVMTGKSLEELGFTEEIWPQHCSVKEAVFPFVKFPGADTLLGPEMKSTGEVMGIDSDFGRAYAKSQIQAGNSLPTSGTVLVSVKDADRPVIWPAVQELAENGFRVLATPGTAADFRAHGIEVETVSKVGRGHPDTVERTEAGEVDLVINTVGSDPVSVRDSASIRRSALLRSIPYFTTVAAARAGVGAIRALQLGSIGVRALQDVHVRSEAKPS
jgi:carbamoyl-phosphate synthase large subunit